MCMHISLHCSGEHKDPIVIPLAFGPRQAAYDLHTVRQSIILIAVDADSFAMDCPACVGQTVRLSVCQSVSLSGSTFVWPRFWGQRVAHLYWGKASWGEVGPQWSEASSQPSNINKLNIDVANAQLTINLSKPRAESRVVAFCGNRNCNEIGIGIGLEPSNDLVPCRIRVAGFSPRLSLSLQLSITSSNRCECEFDEVGQTESKSTDGDIYTSIWNMA